MAEYILKDSRGKEQTFADDKIFVQGTDGELVQFTMGTGEAVLENLEVTENGTYAPGEGVDGFGSVVVDVDSTKITILPQSTLYESMYADGMYGTTLENPGIAFNAGEKYYVKWDGEDYECVGQDASEVIQTPGIVVGDASMMGLSGNGEPFFILYMFDATMLEFACLTDTAPTVHTVGIQKEVTQAVALQDKTITENGTYTADEGFDGLGSVTVEVAEESSEVILDMQTITGFTANAEYGGAYTSDFYLDSKEIVQGQEYLVQWDDLYYSVTAEDASTLMDGALFLGNGSNFGLSGNGEPFAIGYKDHGVTFVSLADTAESHVVAIVKRVRPELLLLEDMTITENGEYTADAVYDGIGKVTVNVAGSGGGLLEEPLTASGEFTPTSNKGVITITHGLGKVPDYVEVSGIGVTSDSVHYMIGFRSGIPAKKYQTACKKGTQSTVFRYSYPIENDDINGFGLFNNADEDIVKLGGSLCTLDTSVTYNWMAIRFLQ